MDSKALALAAPKAEALGLQNHDLFGTTKIRSCRKNLIGFKNLSIK